MRIKMRSCGPSLIKYVLFAFNVLFAVSIEMEFLKKWYGNNIWVTSE